MKNDMMASFSDYGKTALAAAKELVDINSKLMGKLLESQISLANLYVESTEKQLATVQTTTDPKEYMSKQAALLEEYATKLAAAAQTNVKLAQDAGEEMKGWFEKGMKTAEKEVKKAAASAAPMKTATKMPAVKKAAASAAPIKAAPKKPAVKKAPTKKPAAAKVEPKAKG
jgi:sec-independent protein translocase protein TatB